MISALTKIPPTARSRPGQPMRAQSDTRSCPALPDGNQMCGMTVFARSFQARTLSLSQRPRADADHVHAARRRVRARRQNSKDTIRNRVKRFCAIMAQKFGRRLACRRLAAIRSHGRMMRPECGRRPNEKARGRFPGAGCCDFCDDEQMPVICPTCQLIFKTAREAPALARACLPES